MPKVLFTSHLANFVKFNKPFMHWFQQQGWEVHYASLDEEPIPNCEKHFKVSFNRSPFRLDNMRAYFQLKKIIDREQYDMIHCHTPMGGVVTRLAARRARKNGTKVIYTAHGFHFYQGAPKINWLFYYPVEKWLARYTDCLITINEEDYRLAVSKHFKAGSIEKIDGVGVDLTRFYPATPEEKQRLRREYGFSEEDFILMCVAEFTSNKNQIFLIEQMPALQRQCPRIRLVLVGKGAQMQTCKQKVQELALEQVVRFLGYRRDVDRLYRCADLCVSASYREGLPVNIIEAMACGLPIVCTDIRGQRDLVQDGLNGFLFACGDTETYKNSVEKLRKDKEFCQCVGQNNTERAKKNSVNLVLGVMQKIYQRYFPL